MGEATQPLPGVRQYLPPSEQFHNTKSTLHVNFIENSGLQSSILSPNNGKPPV